MSDDGNLLTINRQLRNLVSKATAPLTNANDAYSESVTGGGVRPGA